MLEMIKKIFSVLSSLPAFTNLFKNAAQTGKIDPTEALSALSSISPGTKKCADVAVNTVQRGGGIPEVMSAVMNTGEIEVMGQKINTKTMIGDLEKAGGICSVMANLLKNLPKQSPADIAKFGEAASDLRNYEDLVKNY